MKIHYSESQIDAAIKMYKNDGLSLQAVADKFGFTRSWLRLRFVDRNVKFRQRWASQWRRCRICEHTFRVNKKNFYHKKDYRCKKCAVKVQRTRTLKEKFGMTMQDYNRLLRSQDGACAICGTAKDSRNLSIDHNHETGEIRGLLCGNCNTGLGMFQDSIEIMQRAIAYIG